MEWHGNKVGREFLAPQAWQLVDHRAIARLVVLDLKSEKLVDRVQGFFVVGNDVDSSAAWSFHQIPMKLILEP